MNNFAACYALLAKSFPTTELRTFAEQEKLLNNKFYHLLEYIAEDKLHGVMCYWDFEDFLYLEHLAIAPEVRGMGLGKQLVSQLLVKEKLIVLEAEPPIDSLSTRRVAFYQRLGFRINDFFYLQPPLRSENTEIELKLMTSGKKLSSKELLLIKQSLYQRVYQQGLTE